MTAVQIIPSTRSNVTTARNAYERKILLRDLEMVLVAPPEQQERCVAAGVVGLQEFGQWLAGRRCEGCGGEMPVHRTSSCKKTCKRRLQHRRAKSRAPQQQVDPTLSAYEQFVAGIVKPALVEDIAKKLGITECEAREKAEVDIERGRLVGYRPGGVLRVIGVPR